MWRTRIIFTVLCPTLFAACGTEVKVGRNDTYTPKDATLFGGEETDGGADGNGDATTGAALNSCYGAAQTLPEELQVVCDTTPAEIKTVFAKAFKTFCEDKKMQGLWQKSCSWQGTDAKEKYLKVHEKSDLNDTASQEFSLFSTFSVTVPDTPKEYADTVFAGYADPNFTQKYKTVKNSKLSQVSADQAKGQATYHVELATSAAVVAYDGQINIVPYSNGWYGVFDQAITNKTLIVTSHFMYLIKPAGEGLATVVAFDEKVVSDGGNHLIAAQTAIGLEKERMDLAQENARR